MMRSRLTWKLFASTVPVILALALAIYGFSVPLIKRTAFELEEHAGRAVLDTVYESANRIHLNLESHRRLALDAHRLRLKNIVEIASSYVDSRVCRGAGGPSRLRPGAATRLRHFARVSLQQ